VFYFVIQFIKLTQEEAVPMQTWVTAKAPGRRGSSSGLPIYIYIYTHTLLK